MRGLLIGVAFLFGWVTGSGCGAVVYDPRLDGWLASAWSSEKQPGLYRSQRNQQNGHDHVAEQVVVIAESLQRRVFGRIGD